MAVDSGKKLTTYTSAVTVVTAEVMNALYGGEYAHNLALYAEDQYHPLVAGHVHDGEHADGHASKILLSQPGAHVRGALSHANLGGTEGTNTEPAVQKDNIQCYSKQQYHAPHEAEYTGNAIPVFEVDPESGDKCYYLDLSMAVGGDDTHIQYNKDGEFAGDAGFVYKYENGQVGINTSTPRAELHIEDNNIGSGEPSILLVRSNPMVEPDDLLGWIGMRGNETATDGEPVPGGGVSLVCSAEEAFTGSDAGSSYSIWTTSIGNTARTEKVRVSADGNVGIGTITPSAKLDVIGDGIFTGDLTVGNKLTVGGLIDPTGLILTEEDEGGTPGVPTEAGQGAIFVSDGNGNHDVNNNPLEKNKLYYKDENGAITKLGGGGDPSPPEESVQYNWQGQFAGDSSIRIGHTSKNLGVGVTDPAEPARRLHVKDAEGVPPVRINDLPLGEGENVVWSRTTGDLYHQPHRTVTTPGIRTWPVDGSDIVLDVGDIGTFVIITGLWNGSARVIIPDLPPIPERFPEGWPDGVAPQPSPGPDPVPDSTVRLGQWRTGNTMVLKNLSWTGEDTAADPDTYEAPETYEGSETYTSSMSTSGSSDAYTYELMAASVDSLNLSADLQALAYNIARLNYNTSTSYTTNTTSTVNDSVGYMLSNSTRATHARLHSATIIVTSPPGSHSTLDGERLFYILPPKNAIKICCIKDPRSSAEGVDGYEDTHWFIMSHYHPHIAEANMEPMGYIIASKLVDGEVVILDSGAVCAPGYDITFDGTRSNDPDLDPIVSWIFTVNATPTDGSSAEFEVGVFNTSTFTLGTQALDGHNIAVSLVVSDGKLSSQPVFWSGSINTQPVITAGDQTINEYDTFTHQATAWDSQDGDITNNITFTALHGSTPVTDVNPYVSGIYTVHYDVMDSGGLSAETVTVTITVVAYNTQPVIHTPGDETVVQYQPFNPLDNVWVDDVEDGQIDEQLVVNISDSTGGTNLGSVDTSNPQVFTITYDADDYNGLAAETVTRVITVVAANTQPVITATNQTINEGETFVPDVTVTDTEDGSTITSQLVTVITDASNTVVGSVDSNTPQVYTITYDVTDSGNWAAETVAITVTVNAKPVITATDQTINQYETFVHQVTVADEDSVIPAVYTISDSDGNTMLDSVDTTVPQVYTIDYDATDSNGLAADTVTITVTVVAADIPPVIVDFTVRGDTTVGGEVYIDAAVLDQDGTIKSYSWSLGGTPYSSTPDFWSNDSASGDNQVEFTTVGLVGQVAGDYTVTLTVTDNDDLVTSASTTVTLGPHYASDMEGTGESQLVIFENTITTLVAGDEIAIFDLNGVKTTCTYPCSSPDLGETLVGAAVWTGGQTEVVGTISIDLSAINGPILNGAIAGNPVVVKVWKAFEEREYIAYAHWNTGTGEFGEVLLTVSELNSPPAWEDNPGGYANTATISGLVIGPDGDYSFADPGDLFAAFDNSGNVRGVAVPLIAPFGPYMGETIYEMQLRGDSSGDLLSFKYYDASEDTIIDINETYVFTVNDIVGDITSPEFFTTGTPSESSGSSGQGSSGSGWTLVNGQWVDADGNPPSINLQYGYDPNDPNNVNN